MNSPEQESNWRWAKAHALIAAAGMVGAIVGPDWLYFVGLYGLLGFASFGTA